MVRVGLGEDFIKKDTSFCEFGAKRKPSESPRLGGRWACGEGRKPMRAILRYSGGGFVL